MDRGEKKEEEKVEKYLDLSFEKNPKNVGCKDKGDSRRWKWGH